ncbi:hypothetical protein NLU13_3491 [Sarocladium strictum]|uniref:Uncharacterized protein n=1 Tax=Sarocladium strictum TaxID=5046 RepID=A0AA39GM38_SARSR|nr:hypothetical protein NLU13_3491 [Sarocladium strictum]
MHSKLRQVLDLMIETHPEAFGPFKFEDKLNMIVARASDGRYYQRAPPCVIVERIIFPSQRVQPAWYEAQLLHYGLPTSSDVKVAMRRLHALIKDHDGKRPARVPHQILKLEREFRKLARWRKGLPCQAVQTSTEPRACRQASARQLLSPPRERSSASPPSIPEHHDTSIEADGDEDVILPDRAEPNDQVEGTIHPDSDDEPSALDSSDDEPQDSDISGIQDDDEAIEVDQTLPSALGYLQGSYRVEVSRQRVKTTAILTFAASGTDLWGRLRSDHHDGRLLAVIHIKNMPTQASESAVRIDWRGQVDGVSVGLRRGWIECRGDGQVVGFLKGPRGYLFSAHRVGELPSGRQRADARSLQTDWLRLSKESK